MKFTLTRGALKRYDEHPWNQADVGWGEKSFEWFVQRSFQLDMGDGDNHRTTEKYFAMSVEEIRRIVNSG